MPLLSSCNGHALALLAGAMGRLWQCCDAEGDTAHGNQTDGKYPSAWFPQQPSLSEGRSDNRVTHCPMAAWSYSMMKVSQRRIQAVSASDYEETRGAVEDGLGPEDLVSLALALPLLQRTYIMNSRAAQGGMREYQETICIGMPSLSNEAEELPPVRLLDPPPGWISDLTSAALRYMPFFSSTQLTNILMALARIDKQQQLQHQCSKDTDSTSVPQLSRSIDASTSSAHRQHHSIVSSQWLREWLLASARISQSFNAADTAQSLWALATLGATSQPFAAPQGASSHQPKLRSPHKTRSRHSQRAKSSQARSSRKLRPHRTPEVVLSTAPSIGSGGSSKSRGQKHETVRQLRVLLRQNQKPIAPPLATAPLHVPPQWITLMLSRTRPRLAVMSAPHVSMMVWALSKLKAQPGWQWSLALFDASTHILRQQVTSRSKGHGVVDPGSDKRSRWISGSTSCSPNLHLDRKAAQAYRYTRPDLEVSEQDSLQNNSSSLASSVSPRDLAVLLMGLGRLRLRPLQVDKYAFV